MKVSEDSPEEDTRYKIRIYEKLLTTERVGRREGGGLGKCYVTDGNVM